MKIILDANALKMASYLRQGGRLAFADVVFEMLERKIAESVVLIPEILVEKFPPLRASDMDMYGEIYEIIQRYGAAVREHRDDPIIETARNRLLSLFHGKLHVGDGLPTEGRRPWEEQHVDLLLYLAPYIEIPAPFIAGDGTVNKAKVTAYCTERKLNIPKPDRGENAAVQHMVSDRHHNYVFITADINAIERYMGEGKPNMLKVYEHRLDYEQTEQCVYVVSPATFLYSIASVQDHHSITRQVIEEVWNAYPKIMADSALSVAVLIATAYMVNELSDKFQTSLVSQFCPPGKGGVMAITSESKTAFAEAYEAMLRKEIRIFRPKELQAFQTDVQFQLNKEEAHLATFFAEFLQPENIAAFKKAVEAALPIFLEVMIANARKALDKHSEIVEEGRVQIEASMMVKALDDVSCQALFEFMEIPLEGRIPAAHTGIKAVVSAAYLSRIKPDGIRFGWQAVAAVVMDLVDAYYTMEIGGTPVSTNRDDFDTLHQDTQPLRALLEAKMEALNQQAKIVPLSRKAASAILEIMQADSYTRGGEIAGEYHASAIGSFAAYMLAAVEAQYLARQAEAAKEPVDRQP